MADILGLLGQLEEEEARQKAQRAAVGNKQKGKGSKKNRPKDLTTQNTSKNTGKKRVSTGARTTPITTKIPSPQAAAPKPATAPASADTTPTTDLDSPTFPFFSSPEPSPESTPDHDSRGRRISFGSTPRPSGNKLIIPTRTDSLASGFPYDLRLNKYRVSEEEWTDFNNDLMSASAIPGPTFLWTFRKKEVITRIKRDLQYGGDMQRTLKKWNKLFKRQRFQAFLEIPGEGEAGEGGPGSKKRFRIVVRPNAESRAPSVYSRNSSMTRSVSGEGKKALSSDDECAVE